MDYQDNKESTFLAWIVRMSLIKRWALMYSFREENVSEHSHQTAVIANMDYQDNKESTFLAWIVRMSLIKRWALMYSFREENVSEHSHQTAVIAHMLCIIKNRLFNGHVDANQAAVLALYHEVSESKLQDLNSKTKYLDPEFTRQYKLIEHQAGHVDANQAAVLALYHEVSESKLQDLNSKTKYLDPEFTRQYKLIEHQAEVECLNTLPKELQADFEHLVIQDNTDPELKDLVKAADCISAYIKANDELRFSNQEFTHVKEGLDTVLDKYCERLPEVKYFMEVFVPLCWTPADKLAGIDRENHQAHQSQQGQHSKQSQLGGSLGQQGKLGQKCDQSEQASSD